MPHAYDPSTQTEAEESRVEDHSWVDSNVQVTTV